MPSFAERFPEISDIRVKVFSVRGAIAPRTPFREFGLSVPEYVECFNPRCKNGRFRLWPVIAMACSRADATFCENDFCYGNERRHDPRTPCLYTFTVEGEITYKPNERNATR